MWRLRLRGLPVRTHRPIGLLEPPLGPDRKQGFGKPREKSPPVIDMPRESIPSRSRENGLRDPVKAGLAGVLCTQQTQLSISSELPAADFPAGSGTGSGPGAAVSVHCAAKNAGALSRRELCGRTWL